MLRGQKCLCHFFHPSPALWRTYTPHPPDPLILNEQHSNVLSKFLQRTVLFSRQCLEIICCKQSRRRWLSCWNSSVFSWHDRHSWAGLDPYALLWSHLIQPVSGHPRAGQQNAPIRNLSRRTCISLLHWVFFATWAAEFCLHHCHGNVALREQFLELKPIKLNDITLHLGDYSQDATESRECTRPTTRRTLRDCTCCSWWRVWLVSYSCGELLEERKYKGVEVHKFMCDANQ